MSLTYFQWKTSVFRLVIENVILKTRFVKEQEAKELLCSLGSNFF